MDSKLLKPECLEELDRTPLLRRMMEAMGLPNDGDVLPATQALVRTMLDCCKSERFMVGLGALCLGAEAIVPHVYGTIVAGCDAVGEPRERLRFFELHIAEDDDHAQTMLRVIEREIAADPALQIDLDYGGARAISARAAFFRAISDASLPA